MAIGTFTVTRQTKVRSTALPASSFRHDTDGQLEEKTFDYFSPRTRPATSGISAILTGTRTAYR